MRKGFPNGLDFQCCVDMPYLPLFRPLRSKNAFKRNAFRFVYSFIRLQCTVAAAAAAVAAGICC